MAKSAMNKSFGATIKGVLDIDDDKVITVEVEDVENPITLADFIADFKDKEVKISITYGEEL